MNKALIFILAAILLVLSLSGVAQAQTCFGIDAGNSAVCSGHGTCTGTDTCSCFTGYSTANCSQLICGWSDGSLGAPQPTVTTQVTADLRVLITVVMSKKHAVAHSIGLTEPLSCAETPYHKYSDFVVSSDSSCSTTYLMNVTLQQWVSDNNVTKTFNENGDIFELGSTIYTTYTETPVNQSCFLTTFKTPYKVMVYLFGTSFATFSSSNVPIGSVRQKSIRVDSNGKLNLAATLTLNTPGKLDNFTFLSSTAAGVVLTIGTAITNENCGAVEGGAFCSYSLTIASTQSAADYSGMYVFRANLYRLDSNQNVSVDIGFSLQYVTPTPPAVGSVNFTTSVALYNADYSAPKTVFTTLEEAWVLNAIVQKISVPGRALTVRNAFLCCMKNRAPMPAYNPDNGQLGCAAQTSEMDIWARLVNAEVPLFPQYNTRTRPLPFVDDKTGFSFSVLPLVGDDRLCFLQVESYLKSKSRTNLNNYAEETLLAFAPMQIVPGNSADGKTPGNNPVSVAAGVHLPMALLFALASFILLAVF